MIGIDEGAFSEKPAKLAKIKFTGIDGSIENSVEKLEAMSKIAQKGDVIIYINKQTLENLIQEKEKKK